MDLEEQNAIVELCGVLGELQGIQMGLESGYDIQAEDLNRTINRMRESLEVLHP